MLSIQKGPPNTFRTQKVKLKCEYWQQKQGTNLSWNEGSLIHIARTKKNYAIETAIASQTLSTVLRSVPGKGKLNTNSQLKIQLDAHLPMFIYLQDSDSPTGATNETI